MPLEFGQACPSKGFASKPAESFGHGGCSRQQLHNPERIADLAAAQIRHLWACLTYKLTAELYCLAYHTAALPAFKL